MARTGTLFGGVAGEMLSRTVSPGSVFTGVLFLLAVGALGATAERVGRDLLLVGGLLFVVSFFLAHFAVEGSTDQWERAGRSIPPTAVGAVALRYLVLSIVVLAPMLFVAQSRAAALALVTTPRAGAILALIYVLAATAAPPALLVGSVSASSFRDLVSLEHWRSRFRSRWGDFFLIYVIFIGALVCVVLACLPIVGFAATRSADAMRVASGAIVVFGIGFSISLLGRLCGSFAVEPESAIAETTPATLHPALSPFAGAAAAHSGAPGGAVPAAPAAPPRKSALLDAGARVEQLRTEHASDPAAFAAALRDLDEAFLPHPAVGQARTLALAGAGRRQEAVDVARDAIPLCLKSGNVAAAALMYEALLASGETFGLTKDQIVALGDSLKSLKRPGAAVRVYAGVLRAHAGDVKAMKAMIAIAEDLSQQKDTAAQAVQVYDYLIAHCAGSPLLDFVNAERAKAQRKAD
jgi:hypothetical protein